MGARKRAEAVDLDNCYWCLWCNQPTMRVKELDGKFYCPGDCVQAAIVRKRLKEAEEDFDNSPDETIE